MLPMVCYSRRPQSGQITCYFKRTYHVLPTTAIWRVDFCGTTSHTPSVVRQKPTRPARTPQNEQGEFGRFTRLVDQVLSVPHSVIKERIEEHRRAVARNPHRRGPKSKKS